MDCVDVFGWFCLGLLGFGLGLREGSDPVKREGKEAKNDKGTTTTARDRDSNSISNSIKDSQSETDSTKTKSQNNSTKKTKSTTPPPKKSGFRSAMCSRKSK